MKTLTKPNSTKSKIQTVSYREYGNCAVDFAFSADLIDGEGHTGAGNGHGEGIGAQSGKTAVSQQDRLEDQDDNAKDADGAGPEENGAQARTGHMRAAPGDRGDFKGRNYKYKSAGHG